MKRNYQKELEQLIGKLDTSGKCLLSERARR